jgi:hypothetical protein
MLPILLALASSVAYGISDFLGGLKGRSVPLLAVLLVSQATALVVLSVIVIAFDPNPPSGSFLAGIALAAFGIAATACDADSGRLGQPRALTSVAFGALTALGFGTVYAATCRRSPRSAS